MNLLPFFQWCEASWLGSSIRASQFMFPVIEAFHLVALAFIGGAILLVDFRLLGFIMKQQPVRALAEETQPYLVGSLIVMIITGTLLFMSESVKCYYSNPFWIKMGALALAIIFTFTARKKVVSSDEGRGGAVWSRAAAVTSIVLWGTVAWGGRWIGFSG
jgi:uncharacterized protein DUF6644